MLKLGINKMKNTQRGEYTHTHTYLESARAEINDNVRN